MQIDRQTLDDLDVAGLAGATASLITYLDHTWSRGGGDRLREMVLSPLSTVDEIENRQRTLQRLSGRLDAFGVSNLGTLVDRAERYMASSYLELPSSWLGCLSVKWSYPDMVEGLVGDLEAIARLIPVASAVLSAVEGDGAGAELESIVERLRRFLASPGIDALRRAPRGTLRQLALARLDHTIRKTDRKVLEGFVKALHQLDALHALARASSKSGFAYPTVVESQHPFISATDAFHPLVANATSYDIELGPMGRLLFLTGPNMAGKTTYLKTCGIVALMAHIGMAVPASRATLSRFDRLFSLLAVRDSIGQGESLFLAEVRRVRDLVARLARGERLLVLADEMFRATNLLDAQDATELVLTQFSSCEKSLFVVSSHLIELAGRMHGQNMRFAHFEASLVDTSLVFSYQLEPGVSDQRLGMVLLEREGVTGSLAKLPKAQSVA